MTEAQARRRPVCWLSTRFAVRRGTAQFADGRVDVLPLVVASDVALLTHLGGMLVGYLYLRRGSWFYRARNGISDWQRRRARRKFEVYMRKHRNEPPSHPDHWVN